MGDQNSIIMSHLLQLDNPSTTPEKALLLLSSPCLSPGTHAEGGAKHLVIFSAYMKFIMSRRPDECLDGIWEEILLNAIRHSRYFTDLLLNKFRNNNTKIINTLKILIQELLSTSSKCPNPYIRLELFRLLIIFKMEDTINWECLSETFMNTICEINPHRFHPSDDEDDLMFGIINLNHVIIKMYGKLIEILDSDDHKNIDGDKFITHIVQLFAIFTNMADCKPIIGTPREPLSYCCIVFQNFLDNFQHIVSRPSIQPYVLKAISDLTATIINSKKEDYLKLKWLDFRENILVETNACSKLCDLPRLLFLHQVQGPCKVRQHALLLKDLKPLYKHDHITMTRQLFGSNIADALERDMDRDLS